MQKSSYFASVPRQGWPRPDEIERYFLAPPPERWFFETGNDSAGFKAEGVDGTEHLQANKGRIDIRFELWGHPQLGVLMIWSKWGGGYKLTFTSVGDLDRLSELVRSAHGTPLPVGLFIPFERAWPAVKEFLQTDGRRSSVIEWIANSDLPPNTFPDPQLRNASELINFYKEIAFRRHWDKCSAFRWAGDFEEGLAAYQAATAYAKVVDGVVFDPQDGVVMSPQEAFAAAEQFKADLPKMKEAVKSALAKLRKP